MNFQETIQNQQDNGFKLVENFQNKRAILARFEADGTMTIFAIVNKFGEVKSQTIKDAEKNNPGAFKKAMQFKERGLW